MADAVIDQVAFGLVIGGTGTDNTEVFSDQRQIKALYFSGNADAATCVIQTKDPAGLYVTAHHLSAQDTNHTGLAEAWFGESGSTFKGMMVNLSHANDRLFIHMV